MKRPVIHRSSGASSKLLRVPLYTKCIDVGQHVQVALSVFEHHGATSAELHVKSLLAMDTVHLEPKELTALLAMVSAAAVFCPEDGG